MRLPPLRNLRVTNPNQASKNPCIGVMATLLSCWASQGYAVEGCGKIEEQLRSCMDAKKGPPMKKNNINYHLGRLYPMIKPPHKKWKGYQ
ncbi:hypothetical protein P167DRAFT_514186 [Morchella conica CCBAS932]|uniref:Small ribosomal subunit protein mS37 n=2 Tax=Morchella sect. Distantes TaxID=1051054 RepID=A0A3N4KBI9_9PEZI|nr:hypothetical protein P167DRAFT_514186 [Morchella conica CCBAS932]